MTRRAMIGAAVALLAACGGGGNRAADPAATATGATGAAGTGAAGAAATGGAPGTPGGVAGAGTVDAKGCLHDGRWRACGFVDRLERAGLVVGAARDTVRHDFLSVPGVRYELGRGAAEAFFYDDTTRLARDVAALDTARVAPLGGYRHWDTPATFVRAQNLVVIVLSANEHLVERVQLAVEAGAPQPEPPAEAQTLAPVTSRP